MGKVVAEAPLQLRRGNVNRVRKGILEYEFPEILKFTPLWHKSGEMVDFLIIKRGHW